MYIHVYDRQILFSEAWEGEWEKLTSLVKEKHRSKENERIRTEPKRTEMKATI